ncbi:hypothetical protein [Streptomyces longwoodensis]|uniref:hypothetical protein n=1 Tax=Streptomyces longwoodensis TaxID=68231 RepID=UPI00324A6E6A
MPAIHKITNLDDTWRSGDVVLDADGNLRVRSAHPLWVWDYPDEGSTRAAQGGPQIPEGGLAEHDVKRPLTLLVRDGQAVAGRQIDESAHRRNLTRSDHLSHP